MKVLRKHHAPGRRPGFALIIALSLMALMVLLTVSLSTMVQVELSTSTHRNNHQEARMNALYGMQVALGELQRYMGPDQRVSAPATVVYPNDTNGNDAIETTFKSHAGSFGEFRTFLTPDAREVFDSDLKRWWADRNPHWIGAFHADRDNGLHKRDQLPAWLVSGNERFTIDDTTTEYPVGYQTPDTDNTQINPEDYVYLVDANSATPLNDNIPDDENVLAYDGRVIALKQPIVNQDGPDSLQTGNFAYWVGDESLKANFAIIDPYYDVTNKESREYRNRLQSPQRVGWENISGFEIVGSAAEGAPSPNDERLAMLTSSSQIQLLDDSGSLEDPVKDHFHSLTAYSRGLMVDVVNGGFKKDLTVYFNGIESDTNGGIKDSNPIPNPDGNDIFGYATDDRMGTGNLGFPHSDENIPTWGELKEWYENEGSESKALDVSENVSPVITYMRFFMGFSYQEGNIRMHILPTINMWNPYDAALKSTS